MATAETTYLRNELEIRRQRLLDATGTAAANASLRAASVTWIMKRPPTLG